MRRPVLLLALAIGAVWLDCGDPRLAQARATAQERSARAPRGRPRVELDRLDLSRAPLAAGLEKDLRSILAREARRVEWGAGRGARIVYRFRIDDLTLTVSGDVLKVTCGATGWLPKGKVAKSRLSFGGSPAERDAVVRHVLDIVARGVLTRLAELERERREREQDG
jgi:hypothetical protein